MATRPYKKTRFLVIGSFNPDPNDPQFPPRPDGNYVIGKLIDKFIDPRDVNVIEGNNYPLFWPTVAMKCDAPSPPFQAGDGGAVLEENRKIRYKKYCKDSFKIRGDFNAYDTIKYPRLENDGEYKIASCTNILTKDPEVKETEFYIIQVYPNSEEVNAPNPPFKTGQNDCK